ncbi:MAG: prepilin-type N-terminal cleavage/methylation domain-containing protein [Pseudomonadota bacterium]|nr:prepilin-type N-terminal cleavage/methylation domain-containing protein [Pseudomonadota bacterium]
MKQKQGFTLLEMLITLGVVGALILVAGYFMGWSGSSYKEQAYVRALEDSISRSIHYAQKLEQPVAICFELSEGCGAEGILTPIDREEGGQILREWQLLEALPAKQHILLRTNFPDNRLLIQAGGQSVQRPGAVSICAMDQELAYTWSISISRAGKISVRKLDGEQSLSVCSQSA